ncbi:hypothetical protein VNO77_15993 [Canavalia gladiata]|uniref:Uncharacterized protein n=1 Tax=Canavalia gladiata TaxID=3824 RepID=A0AAN9M0A8_CANGL
MSSMRFPLKKSYLEDARGKMGRDNLGSSDAQGWTPVRGTSYYDVQRLPLTPKRLVDMDQVLKIMVSKPKSNQRKSFHIGELIQMQDILTLHAKFFLQGISSLSFIPLGDPRVTMALVFNVYLWKGGLFINLEWVYGDVWDDIVMGDAK